MRGMIKLKEWDFVYTDVLLRVLNCGGNDLLSEDVPVDLEGGGQYDYATDQ